MSNKHATTALLFLSSFAKLTLIVYPLAGISEATFQAGAHSVTRFAAWLGLLAFALQTIMAISAGADFFRATAIMRDRAQTIAPFDASYRSASLTLFWRRWTSWLFDSPLGAIALTWGMALIFYGFSWSQLVWLALMALLLWTEKRWLQNRPLWFWLPKPLASVATFLVLLVTWVPLRAASLEHTWLYYRALVNGNELDEGALFLDALTTSDSNLLLLIASLIIAIVLPTLQSLIDPIRRWKLALAATLALGLISYRLVLPVHSAFNGLLTRTVQRGSPSVFVGREGWFYDQRELTALTGTGALDREVTKPGKPQSHAPEEIVRFIQQLKERGVPLLLIPLPMKASIYPEFITGIDPDDELETRETPVYHACEPPLHDQLIKAGADVANLGNAMIELRNRKTLVFHKHDSRWTPEAMQLFAKGIVNHIRTKYPGVAAGNPMIIDAKAREATDYGDLAARLHMDNTYGGLSPERAVTLGFPDIVSDPKSPVVLLGDEFARLYDDPALGFTPDDQEAKAGFAQHLALYLGRSIDVITQNGGAATTVRRTFAQRLDDEVREKKLVIWLLPVRDLIASPSAGVDWSPVTFNEAKRPPEAILPMVPRP